MLKHQAKFVMYLRVYCVLVDDNLDLTSVLRTASLNPIKSLRREQIGMSQKYIQCFGDIYIYIYIYIGRGICF